MELYRNAPTPQDAQEGHREGVHHGLTQSGEPLYVLNTRDAYYDHRKWGFDAGLWEHSYCLHAETREELIVSYHAASQTEKISTVLAAVDWWRQVPAGEATRDED